MSDLSNIDPIKVKSKLTSKTAVSLEKKEEMRELNSLNVEKKIEITMEEADHAFALMTEIKQKIETAYNDLTSKLDK